MPRTYSIFDLIGPIMVGPSSSHTAGAARLAKLARNIFGQTPEHCVVSLYGSFAETYQGHGTHFAIAGGLMGWSPDDERMPQSLREAQALGLDYQFVPMPKDHEHHHPNTAALLMSDTSGRSMNVVGASLGGGVIAIHEIDGFALNLQGNQHTTLILHFDRPGVITRVTRALADDETNISSMLVSRAARGSYAMMVIETDQRPSERARLEISALKHVERASCIEPVGGV